VGMKVKIELKRRTIYSLQLHGEIMQGRNLGKKVFVKLVELPI
jgi:hypothetical protein